MTITLTPEQKAWLEAGVARGDFPSIEAAARQLIDERIAEHAIDEEDDLSGRRPQSRKDWRRWSAAMSCLSKSIDPATLNVSRR